MPLIFYHFTLSIIFSRPEFVFVESFVTSIVYSVDNCISRNFINLVKLVQYRNDNILCYMLYFFSIFHFCDHLGFNVSETCYFAIVVRQCFMAVAYSCIIVTWWSGSGEIQA